MPEMPPRTAIGDASLSMILAAANAELFLDHLLDRWHKVLKAKLRAFEIVLVDDASTDATVAQSKAWQAKHPELTVVSSEAPHGIGACWRAGLQAAKSNPLIGFCEFSPDYNPDDFGKLFEILNQVDLVSGVRPVRASRWSGRALLERWVFGIRLVDSACPFKLFRRTVFDHLPLQSRGDFVHAEIVAKANFLGSVLAEVPIEYHRGGTPASDPFWKDDMRLVFRDPDFGPPPAAPTPAPTVGAGALAQPVAIATEEQEEEVL
jgi:glycosyltransferase involved in cell wall biosynthesis